MSRDLYRSDIVNIDKDALRAYVKENGFTLDDLSIRIGRSHAYLSCALKVGNMKGYIYSLLMKTLGLPEGTFLAVKKEPVAEDEYQDERIDGYEIQMSVFPDRLKMTMTYQKEKMYESWAIIKGNTELDLMQAVSYSAHMLYKKAEQEFLQGK